MYSIILIFTIITISKSSNETNYNVIPLPKNITKKEGNPFILNNNTQITYYNESSLIKQNAEFLSELIQEKTTLKLKITPNLPLETPNTIYLLIKNISITQNESYIIEINETIITIESKEPNGQFYGIQTLFKSLPITIKNPINEISLPQVQILDYPFFSYRGMMLDCSRHFYSISFIKKYIKLLSLHNMNRFHWHLTDDQGWRIEIKKYPLLTQLSSRRKNTVINKNTGYYDDTPYGGFYTQEEAKEIVKYASSLYITVIPEIDMPGHIVSALHAYPNLACKNENYEVKTKWGVFDEIMCAGKEETFEFIENIYNELIDIFPSEYYHIGGDEVPKTRWKECELCQKRMKDENITSEEKLQGYFSMRVEKILNKKGKKVIGWDEILNGDIQQSATIMNWRGVEKGQEAVQKGHDVILSPTKYLYIDKSQSKTYLWREPLTIGGHLPLDFLYNFNPLDKLSDEEKKKILGIQANLWSEYIICENMGFYQALPRMAAVAELQWLKNEDKNFQNFIQRLKIFQEIYDLYGVVYEKIQFREE